MASWPVPQQVTSLPMTCSGVEPCSIPQKIQADRKGPTAQPSAEDDARLAMAAELVPAADSSLELIYVFLANLQLEVSLALSAYILQESE